MHKEIWEPIEGFQNYQVSTKGRVRSFNGKIISIQKGRFGYLSVRIAGPKKRKTLSLHRLVAKTFIPNPENKPQVNHKDRNKENNCLYNLEWMTPGENVRHAYENKERKINYTSLLQLDNEGNVLQEFLSVKKAAESINRSCSAIQWAIKNETKSGDFYWKRKENPKERFLEKKELCKRVKIPLVGFENYETTEYGDIYNIKRQCYMSLRTKGGYKSVKVTRHGICKNKDVHILVALAFVPNLKNKPMVNHIDGNPSNNYWKNLEWVTRRENGSHAAKLGRNGVKPVLQYDLSGKFIAEYSSMTEAARKSGANINIISGTYGNIKMKI
jgi:hypothetical protein